MHAVGEGGSPPRCGCAAPTALQTEPGTCSSPAATAACVPRPLYKVLAGTQCCLGPSVPARALQESTWGTPGDSQPQTTCPLPRSASSCPLSSFPWQGHGAGSAHSTGRMQFPCRSVSLGPPTSPRHGGVAGTLPSTVTQAPTSSSAQGVCRHSCLPRPRCVPIWWHPAFPAKGRQPQTGVMLARGVGGSWVPVLRRSLRWVPRAGEAAWPMPGASSNLISLLGLELELATIPAAPKFPLPLSGARAGISQTEQNSTRNHPLPLHACTTPAPEATSPHISSATAGTAPACPRTAGTR